MRSGRRRPGQWACPFPSQGLRQIRSVGSYMSLARIQCTYSQRQERAARTSYFGSRRTYPLLRPLTSLTTISKPLKSTAVTASKATSRRTRDHSKKA